MFRCCGTVQRRTAFFADALCLFKVDSEVSELEERARRRAEAPELVGCRQPFVVSAARRLNVHSREAGSRCYGSLK